MRLAAIVACSAVCFAQSAAPRERTCRIDLLDNGSFADTNAGAVDSNGLRPIPWWRSVRGMLQIEAPSSLDASGVGPVLATRKSEWAEQPIAAFAPLAGSIEIRGSVSGSGRVVLVDGTKATASFPVKSAAGAWTSFTIRGSEAAAEIGHDLSPRFLLRLEPNETGDARWRDLHALVELPCPSEKDLRVEILAIMKKIIEPWLSRALDDEGPRKTAFVCHYFDALTGERTATLKISSYYPLYEHLDNALLVADVPEWRAALERFLEDFLTLGLAPSTGLPCSWDTVKDEPILDQAQEIALAWGFLIDVAEHGPEAFRARARKAAEKIGETVLAHGVQADGNVGASFYPSDARVNPNIVQLRRLDVLAQLARLSALTGDKRYMRAAGEALATFEYTNYWAGTWEQIDPAFDDDYGHYGARAATIALACPDEKLFRNFALDGFAHFVPMWRDALRLGGNVAADQVRCWIVACDLVRIEPSLKARVRPLLGAAVRSHFKGEQYGDGAWSDLTINGFDPRNVHVGDYTGSPQNLLNGLASVYGEDLELSRDELRAMYTAVLRSSVEHYLHPYGFVLDHEERRGQNLALGTMRMLLGLTKMLGKLAQ